MKLFSKEFVKKDAVKDNIVLQFLYIIATPLSKLFIKLNITPNTITFASIVFAISAFVALIVDDGYIYFCIFWVLSSHLDFCDGTVARMTGRIRKSGFRFDHMSDLFKISIIILGAGIHYNTFTIWILSTSAIFSLLYVTILNHQLDNYKKEECRLDKTKNAKNSDSNKKNLKSKAKNSALFLNLFTFLATVNGHTLFFFLVIPFGIIYTEIFLAYFIFLTFSLSIKIINKLLHLPKI